MPPQDQASRLSSVFDPFSVCQSKTRIYVQGGQPCHSSRFSVRRSCGFGRHSSSSAAELFAPATVERKLDHASPASFSVAFRYRFRVALIWSVNRALL
jgi:hypothetical protein